MANQKIPAHTLGLPHGERTVYGSLGERIKLAKHKYRLVAAQIEGDVDGGTTHLNSSFHLRRKQ
jgi:hypothetical protein